MIITVVLIIYLVEAITYGSFSPSNWNRDDQIAGIVTVVALTLSIGTVVIVEKYKIK